MNKSVVGIMFFPLLTALLIITPVFALTSNDISVTSPPYEIINNIKPIDLRPSKTDYMDYLKDEQSSQTRNGGSWSTTNHIGLDTLDVTLKSSSTSKGYPLQNILDKETASAWVEGNSGNGIGEWIGLLLEATKDVEYSTPFTVSYFSMIPGYAKSMKTWTENNRVKTALLVINSPDTAPTSKYKYVVYRLHFLDWNGLQVFSLPNDRAPSNLMIKKVWLIISDIYKGSKYNDTCISEIIIGGNYLP